MTDSNHCLFVLLAEFDIDKGSVLREQYPSPTQIKETSLAEIMLPEGAHLRDTDWTAFHVFKKSSLCASVDSNDSSSVSSNDPPAAVIHVTNEDPFAGLDAFLQAGNNANSDSSASEVRSELPADRPVEGLEHERTRCDEQHAVSSLPSSTSNSTSASSVEQVSDALSFQSLSDTTNTFSSSTSPSTTTQKIRSPQQHEEGLYSLYPQDFKEGTVDDSLMLYGFSVMRKKTDSSVRRGAVVRAVAIITPYRFYSVFQPLLEQALLDGPFDEHLLPSIYRIINNLNLSPPAFPSLSIVEQNVSVALQTKQYLKTGLIWGAEEKKTLPIQIPYVLLNDEVVESSLSFLINLFKQDTMKIYNAILAEKRILFMGFQLPASEVCQCVVSACMLISSIMPGTLRRVFPYTNLTNLQFKEVFGYIAGVTNPLFESRTQWWDVLCNVATKEITLAPGYADEVEFLTTSEGGERMTALDTQHIAEVLHGMKNGCDEEWVRSMFRGYTQHLFLTGLQKEKWANPETRALHEQAYGARWRIYSKTSQFATHKANAKLQMNTSPFSSKDDLIRGHVRALQFRQGIPAEELIVILTDLLDVIVARDDILAFVSYLPLSLGGCNSLALCLFHSDLLIRQLTLSVLSRVDSIPEGQQLLGHLNYYVYLAYHQCLGDKAKN